MIAGGRRRGKAGGSGGYNSGGWRRWSGRRGSLAAGGGGLRWRGTRDKQGRGRLRVGRGDGSNLGGGKGWDVARAAERLGGRDQQQCVDEAVDLVGGVAHDDRAAARLQMARQDPAGESRERMRIDLIFPERRAVRTAFLPPRPPSTLTVEVICTTTSQPR